MEYSLWRIWGDKALFQKFILFKGCIPKFLLSPFFTTLSQMRLLYYQMKLLPTENARKNQDKNNQRKTTPSYEVYQIYIEN